MGSKSIKLTGILSKLLFGSSKSLTRFWFVLSLTFAFIYGVLGWQEAFAGEYVIQDDARQHVFWMQRYLDPQLFPNDLIADYFQSVAPAGYAFLYKLMAITGVHPFLFNKLLPMILALITTSYCFGISLQLLPVPATGFMACLMLNQSLWIEDTLASGTPRAFIYPLLCAFLYYLVRRSLVPCLVAIALQGLFYPQCVFISAGMLVIRLLKWQKGKIELSSAKEDYWLCITGLGVALLVLLPYALITSEYGPAINAAEAKTLPEFLPGGRASFFADDFWQFWVSSRRSGLLGSTMFTPATMCAGLLLPFLLLFPTKLPLVNKVSKQVNLLVQLPLVSLALFFAAHALLFRLHLPSRYTQRSLEIVLALASAIALTLLLNAILNWAQSNQSVGKQILALGAAAIIIVPLVIYPYFLGNSFPKTNNEAGNSPRLYQFFAQTPQDSLIASLSREADFIPSFSARSVLVSREYSIPYHTNYYRQFRQRMVNLIQAQYSPNLAEVQNFIQKYGVDFWLLEDNSLTAEYLDTVENRWLKQYQPAVAEARHILEQEVPALVNLIETCSVLKIEGFTVLDAECIAKSS